MRKLVSAAGLLLLLPWALMAQQTPQAELYTGFSYMRLEKTDQLGGIASLDANINKNLGIVADFSGYTGSQSQNASGFQTNTNDKIYSILAGPRVSDPRGRWNPFAEALFGWARINSNMSTATTSQGVFLSSTTANNAFSMALGGGIDFKLSNAVAIRLIQADYTLLRPHTGKEQGARIGAGLVFRLGRKGQ